VQLTIKSLRKEYKEKVAVNEINMIFNEGVYGLLGANGAGKTTFMRMLCGILNPTKGSVDFDEIDVSEEAYRDVLGYLPQDFGYYPEFTAYDFMLYMASIKGLARSRAKVKTKELLKLVDLEAVSKKRIKTFSGGMKQRLGIAQAMLNDPKILILDEPTAGLDPKERVRFRNLISELGRDRIVLLSTHIVSDIENIATTILVMKDGNIIHKGSLEVIIKEVEGKVYECVASDKEAGKLVDVYPIINTRKEKEGVFLRLVADEKPCELARAVDATLEDLYLYYFSEVRR
jgi:ABC-2 type transport system ATP-binding protein